MQQGVPSRAIVSLTKICRYPIIQIDIILEEDKDTLWTPVTVALTLIKTVLFCSNTDVRHDLYGMMPVWAVSFAVFEEKVL